MSESSPNERKCLVSGELRPRETLIRFVVGPDHSVVPDLAQKLPGKGLWVTADRASIETAAKKNLFAKAAKTSVVVTHDLADQVASLLRRRILDLLGLAKSAGIATLGEPQVESALRAGKLALFLIADDAKQSLDNRSNTPECRIFTRTELGAAFGYAQSVYVGLKPHALTNRISQAIGLWVQIDANH